MMMLDKIGLLMWELDSVDRREVDVPEAAKAGAAQGPHADDERPRRPPGTARGGGVLLGRVAGTGLGHGAAARLPRCR